MTESTVVAHSIRPPRRRRRVALATCSEFPGLDPENVPLVTLLQEAGVLAAPVVWDDPSVEWSNFDLVVIRSTWDYPKKFGSFLRWAASQRRLLNPLPVVRWNADKRYLLELAELGVPIVPTDFIAPGDSFTPPKAASVVVKPAIGAGAKDTSQYEPGQEGLARQHVQRLHAAGRTVMVQPYLARVEKEGEKDLVFIGGRYSHTARKGGMLAGVTRVETALFFQEDIGQCEATPSERAVAERALAAVPGGAERLLFGRVDLLPAEDGGHLVSEVEVIEPSLFFDHCPGSAERLVRLIVQAAME
jgi:glutathione synthase/RimK-type ligase-like ATP-grasp enzyme